MSDLIFIVTISYNPLERRETCKGGKEASKKGAQSQSSSKGTAAAPKTQSSHNARRNDVSSVNTANQQVKASRPSSSGGPAYDEKVLLISSGMRNVYLRIVYSNVSLNADH